MAKIIPILRRGRATDVEREAIAHMWIQGHTYEEIARGQGRSAEYIKRIIHADLGRAEPKYPEEYLEELKQLYEEERWSLTQIAVEYELSSGTAHYLLTKAHTRMRRVGWRQKTDAKWLRRQKNAAEG